MTTLELAAAMRAGTEDFSPVRLWHSAKVDGADYIEAMIHAGAVGPKQDGPFKPFGVCPKCGEALGEAVSHLPDLPEMSDEERAAAASCLRHMADSLVTPAEGEFEAATIDAAVLLYAARYALGKTRGEAQDVEAAIAANLRLFRDDARCRDALVRDICAAAERNGLGQFVDRSSWMRTLGRLEASRGR